MGNVWKIIAVIIFFIPTITSFSQDNDTKPVITGQTPSPLVTQENTPITITLDNLIVTDPDPTPVYPDGFTLELNSGDDYEFSGATVTPDPGFSGILTVRVRVDDGENTSDWFDLKIDVIAAPNVAPQITGQVPITIDQGESVAITLAQLTVTDPDNTYPTDFTLTVQSGSNYTFSGTTVTPAANFAGTLTVHVLVNDGEDNSNVFDLIVNVVAPANVPPQITGQVPIAIDQGESVTITLAQLTVTDPDDNYPTGFTLTVHGGTNYTVNGATVTPAASFFGNLTVQVSVNDGEASSARFDLTVQVSQLQNVVPQITGQSALSIDQGEPITITLAQLTVVDPDNAYPGDFTLTVYSGTSYTFTGTTITPAANFSGTLTVPVSVNDGEAESAKFDLKIEVKKIENQAPTITGQVALSVNQGQSLAIAFGHLVVSDPDNSYPTGFTLTVYTGNNYTFADNTITPAANFSGDLTVPVSVNDGQKESNKFDLKVSVLKVEPSAPQITAQKTLTTNEDVPLAIALSDLTVFDADNTYPQGFSLKISAGQNYSVSGSTIVPSRNYFGPLSVTIKVNDGKNDSAPFQLQVNVSPVNDVPIITGQKKLGTDQDVPLTITLTDLTVTDPDNTFPEGFTLSLTSGPNYTVAGSTITPASTFSGMLNVVVTVSDGKATSPPFSLRVEVNSGATNVAPSIIGQKAISITQNTSVTLQLFHLIVEDPDPDDEFPGDFTLKVSPGANYTLTGTTVKPAASFVSGTLSVGVRVNDGTDDSQLFEVKIQVTPISAKPKIIGQRELAMMEDSTYTITLSDLIVTDSDNTDYPKGFTLKVLGDGEGVYQTSGASITPAADLNGFIEVGVTVSDGANTSDEFRLAILVNPVNDAPKITLLETSALPFEPGKDPVDIFNRMVLSDVDNDYLGMAEVGFRSTNYNPRNDEILFDFDTTAIRVIRDPGGTLFLIGYATVEEYQTALRSMKYNYKITQDFNGNPDEVLSGPRTVYTNVNDGQSISLSSERTVDIEARIALDIPSAFTPNGDNANDTWHLEASNEDQLDQTIVKVYNKRGLLIYESDGFDEEWDGTFNGELLPVDTYYYTIVVKVPYARQTYSGVVTILY